MLTDMKKTTLILEDGCMEGVRRLANEQGRTVTAIVGELLVEGVQRRLEPREPWPLDLPSFDMGTPEVDIADREALDRLMADD